MIFLFFRTLNNTWWKHYEYNECGRTEFHRGKSSFSINESAKTQSILYGRAKTASDHFKKPKAEIQ
jgi:hypothetical protein